MKLTLALDNLQAFSYEGNVSITVSFHKINLDGDDYIELVDWVFVMMLIATR